ncbi:MAG TPA: metallophosphoesterase, partial [Phycisphaerae bacterium]|nr:metallophosphoesterase [Phycisphaerae bacterium]
MPEYPGETSVPGPSTLSRRGFLGGIAAGAGALAGLPALGIAGETAGDGAAGDFSFVHLTDMHVTPKRWGDKGYRRCVETVLAEKTRPAFALLGGDLAFDGLYTPKADFDEQIRLFKEVTGGLGMPVHYCMGNHDALGWSARRKCGADDPELGKRMIMERLEWEKSYYSFDFRGWHFVVLDSIFPINGPNGPAYEPRIGPEQLEWLAYDLGSAAGRPTVALTHIAAFCNIGQQNGARDHKAMDGSMVLWDTVDLRKVLRRHGV